MVQQPNHFHEESAAAAATAITSSGEASGQVLQQGTAASISNVTTTRRTASGPLLVPPAPDSADALENPGFSIERRQQPLSRRSMSLGAENDAADHAADHDHGEDHQERADQDEALCHTPMTTRYAHLPDLHQRDVLDALLLETAACGAAGAAGARPPVRTRSFPRAGRLGEGRRRVRVADHRGGGGGGDGRGDSHGGKDGAIKRSRSKSLGNKHERIITASYEGYRDAETRIKKKKAWGSYGSGGRGGGMGKSMAAYVLSRYGRNEQFVEEDVTEEEEEGGYMMVDESTYLLAGTGGEEEEGDLSPAQAAAVAQARIDATDPLFPDAYFVLYPLYMESRLSYHSYFASVLNNKKSFSYETF